MAAIYGQARWLAHAPLTIRENGKLVSEGVEGEWLDILGGKTISDIARGIEKLDAAPGDYPPGAPQFRKLCVEFQPGTFSGGAQARQISTVNELLEGATVSGSARAYFDLCKQLQRGKEKLTRAQLETLPAVLLQGGGAIRPADVCVASDDVEAACRAGGLEA